ncbi:DUF262 domain-containing protein [Clostridium sp.]|uniref:DUF262 domain-containing protein n=1 Tax=Clostridium sp. TaxID=1506 RepID=UPI00359FEDD4
MAIMTKTIGELKDHRFYVPSYQRGYRWTEHEVTALLDDIYEFSTEGGRRYCLQPLIVKHRDDGSFEVVDGQQRLTTVYIFMKIAEQEIRSAIPPFKIEYETRSDSAEFLKSLSDEGNLDKEKNIDFYHIASAYEKINDWLDNQPDKSVAIQELNTKIRKNVFFICYDIPDTSNPIAIFTKVNLGKIPLTNAELIKALLLNKDNFSEDINKWQTEISVAWDRIEQGLRDDSFWYFLNEKEQSGTRIDMLFDLLANEQNDKLPTPIHTKQNYFPFLVFSAVFNSDSNKEDFVKSLWDKVEKLYAEFRDWYADLDKYHIIGYLISSGVKIAEIFTITRGKRKSAVMNALLEKAKLATGKYDLPNISYDTSNDRQKIRKLLLLFNIATLVCKSEKQYRFPFDIYKGETGEKIKWDIEHIHATADEADEADDSLGNLTLLDAQTNRSYQDAPFVEKRKIIIERESKGLFVPLCTKNIYLKVYSKNLSDMDIWGNEDKKDYVDAMEHTLKSFFDGGLGK